MIETIPNELRDGLAAKGHRGQMRVRMGGQTVRLLRYGAKEFAVDSADAGRLRGLVDIYDGDRPHSQCLVVATGIDDREAVFEIKCRTVAADTAPRDYAVGGEAHEVWT